MSQPIGDPELRRSVDDLRGPVPVRHLLQRHLRTREILVTVVRLTHLALLFHRLKRRPSRSWPASVSRAARCVEPSEGLLRDRQASRLAFTTGALKDAAPVGRDVIGLVALDFVLGIVFRGAMDMTLVVEVSRMDGD